MWPLVEHFVLRDMVRTGASGHSFKQVRFECKSCGKHLWATRQPQHLNSHITNRHSQLLAAQENKKHIVRRLNSQEAVLVQFSWIAIYQGRVSTEVRYNCQ